MTTDELSQAKSSLLNGLADGSIKTVEFKSHQEYLKKIYS